MSSRRGIIEGMNRRRASVTVALAAAACAAVAGCTSTVAGTPLAARGGGSAVTAAAPTTSMAPTLAAAPATAPRWVSIPARPPTRPDKDGAQYGAVAMPGVQIIHQEDADTWRFCTIGPNVYDAAGRLGFLTAGHCAPRGYGEAQSLQADAAGTVMGTDRPLLGTVDDRDTVDDDFAVDSTVIWTKDHSSGTVPSNVAGLTVARVMPEAEVRQLPTDTPICVSGATTGVKCSPLIAPLSTIRFGGSSDGPAAQGGDSGGAVFVTDGHTATLIGLVMEVNGSVAKATYLEPALTRLGARVATVS
jgi:hypothetical protein